MSDEEEVSIKISFAQPDAEFLSALQEHVQPTFLGDYKPDYQKTTQMQDLTWEDHSIVANYKEDIGFTLDGENISALLLDLRELESDIIDTIADHISKLKSLQELIVFLNEDQHIFDFSSNNSLQYVEIHKPRKTLELPPLDTLKKLVVLVVRAHLDAIPELSSNPKLQRLVMRNTSIDIFPQVITELSGLVWLEFGNQFKVLPDEILNLENLVVLDLISDNLAQLPDDLGKLPKLQHLSLETDKLQNLPSTFDQLDHLTDLYLWNLPFESLPKIICEITSLKYLWFKENSKLRGHLKAIPKDIGKLTNLIDLQLNGHKITSIPDTIGNLENLETLNLGINQLTSFNPNILKLSNLQRLELYLNPIEELPDSIGDLKSIYYLDISDTLVTKIPKSISKLRKLKDFDALGCDLDGLPKSIANLNYTKFNSFMVSLREGIDKLDPEVREWIDKLVEYANSNEDKGIEIEISLYEPEKDDKYDDNDNPVLLEDDE